MKNLPMTGDARSTSNQDRELNTRVIISISSDIGTALALHWLSEGYTVVGTYRTWTDSCDSLQRAGAVLYECDLSDSASIKTCAEHLHTHGPWDIVTVAAGTLEPVGTFAEVSFDEWSASVEVNLLAQLRVVHHLLPTRNTTSKLGPLVLFFAGGGTNGAPERYSAYTLSKIALIKACELLHAEIPDTRFSILGPGWVKTKIHQQTLNAGKLAGANLEKTARMLQGDEWQPMERIVECCDWIVASPRSVIGGRNFSSQHDAWGSTSLNEALQSDQNMYKLRRAGN